MNQPNAHNHTTHEVMATATIQARDCSNKTVPCRTLLDTCATANFITQDFARALRLPLTKRSQTVGAMGRLQTRTTHEVTIKIKSRLNNYEKTLLFHTVPEISNTIPDHYIDRKTLNIPANIRLADPEFNRPHSVQMLIGAGPTLATLCIGQIDITPTNGPDLILQKTQFGWIIGGSIPHVRYTVQQECYVSHLQAGIERFWEIEEVAPTKRFSEEELQCEQHFHDHIQRRTDGRYVVALPFNGKVKQLGNTQHMALKRFASLERRFKRDPELQRQYSAVIEEYKTLGHAKRIDDIDDNTGCYLPHHAVIKATSLTTRVRVVFDGSARSTTGVSLNETLMIGPTIQEDIFSLILRFRQHNIVLTGDMEKMYRQIGVRQEDRKYQRILWREADGTMSTYELQTVTFGLSAAPFLAVRCLQQLADDEQDEFPRAAQILRRDVYVDDVLTGTDTLHEALQLQKELSQLLQRGGFNIRQWASNSPALLEGLPESAVNFQLLGDGDPTLKTLGVHWNSSDDAIIYTVNPMVRTKPTTKRTIFSEVAKIFDPLGLVNPIIVTAKLIIQQLWKLDLAWDESVPMALHHHWEDFTSQLPLLNKISFHRKITSKGSQEIQLHGFCDASEVAYGACIYARSTGGGEHIHTSLLCAKSRVAPLKNRQTIPRLELCAANLLANLINTVRNTLTTTVTKTVLWSDSTITLSWIHTSPHTLKTFVANRVAAIQTLSIKSEWRHVRTHDNPADLLSRGATAKDFLASKIWKEGPSWLKQEEDCWPTNNFTPSDDIPDIRRLHCLTTTIDTSILNLLERHSSFKKLIRIVAYCLRFHPTHRNGGRLTANELQNGHTCIIRIVQQHAFADELEQLKKGKPLHSKSSLLPLTAFLDTNGVLRVGGRLQNSSLPYDTRHPIILPKSQHITELIIRQSHLENHHTGVQATLHNLREQYWPLDGRNQVRKVVRQCIRCYRCNPPNTAYRMGNLPGVRITQAHPFAHVGIDYCGPFYIKERRHRNRSRIKVYVAVFICLVVKAVHLEVVSDMTTEAFLAALRRFIARRGKCTIIYTDNGSNFIGAQSELKEIYDTLHTDQAKEQIQRYSADQGIQWHFSPPHCPHFGGLWEAAVKSFKHHLKRVVGTALLTYEQLETLTVEIEGILNSRPLTELSSDPNDIQALTPGHLLIGRHMQSIPEHSFAATPTNRLSLWQHTQKLKQDFWSRWHKEYINQLNIRRKWTKGEHEIQKGSIVIIKDNLLPPLQWALGRVIQLHPGNDGITRNVTIKTASSTLTRNIRKLAPLPVESSTNQQSDT